MVTSKKFSSLKWSLKNDPSYIISFIIQNNPKAVFENFASVGFNNISDIDQAVEAINDILKDEQNGVDMVVQILNVPMLPENMTEGAQQVVLEVANENAQKAMATTGEDSVDPTQKSLAGWGQEGIGLDNIFGALAGGLNGLLAGTNTPINGPAYKPQYGGYNYGPQYTRQANNSWIWIVLAIVAILIAAYFMFRKK